VTRAPPKRAETRTTILAAAKKVLRQSGQAGLSTREVAKAAGVPLSQIHYHFDSKLGLLLALFDFLNVQLLDRQIAMFQSTSLSLSQRWDQACDYLDEDIASGYVRVLQELIGASWSEPEVAKVVREGIMGWINLITDVARKAEHELGGLGPFSAVEAAALIANVFIGGESLYLLGLEKKGSPVRQALRRVGDAIRMAERKSIKPAGRGSHARQAAD
jgi:AcrR family transcriptional regulator